MFDRFLRRLWHCGPDPYDALCLDHAHRQSEQLDNLYIELLADRILRRLETAPYRPYNAV